MDVLRFVFQSFWHWLGTVILIGVIAEGIGGGIRTIIVRRSGGAK